MSKELEILDKIYFAETNEGRLELFFQYSPAIKKALKRLEQIDKALEICKKANEQKYVYIKETYGIIKEDFLDDLDYEFFNNRLYVCSRGGYYDFPLKDYGNWWALTKEELKE